MIQLQIDQFRESKSRFQLLIYLKIITGYEQKVNEKKLNKTDNEPIFTSAEGVCKIILQNVWEGTLEIEHPSILY